MANPRQVHDFGKATGQLAKTDRLDAQLLALFAERVQPAPRPVPDAAPQQLAALSTRRRQLLDMLTAERNRLEHAAAPVRRELTRHIHWLERRVHGGRSRPSRARCRRARSGGPKSSCSAAHRGSGPS